MSDRPALDEGNWEPGSEDFSEIVDRFTAATEGMAAQLVRTLARPLLPGGYDVVRYSSAVAVGVADAAGACTIQFPEVLPGHMWFVDRIGLVASAGSWSSVAFYNGPATMRRLVDVSRNPGASFDISDQANPVVIGQGLTLTAVGAGLAVGVELTVNVQYRLAVAL